MQYPLEEVEAALVAQYCQENGLVPLPGTALAELVRVGGAFTDLRDRLASAERWDLDDLVISFETCVPTAEAARYGAVFTPEAITSFMAREAIIRRLDSGESPGEITVVDPAVGCGALLVAALRELATRSHESPSEITARLAGVDISADSIRRAHLLLSVACLALGDAAEPRARLIVGDTLTADLPALLDRAGEYSIVIANPPYVRYQVLDLATRADLAQNWEACGQGNFNLYFPFFEIAARLASPEGTVCYITPNGFFTGLSGSRLRGWMTQRDWLDEIVDFGQYRVFEALTYTAVTFATNRTTPRPKPTVGYVDVAGIPGLAGLPPAWEQVATTRVPLTDLGPSPWRLVGPSRHQTVAAITARGPRLSEMATVSFGLATLRDKLYLLRGDTDADGNYVTSYQGTTYRIEPGITRRCVKVSSVQSTAELAATRTRIIYPYTLDGTQATVLDEATLTIEYPEAYKYLCAIRAELAQRDHGRKAYAAWYAYGRTQGLVPLGRKLLSPLYAAWPRFLADDNEESLFINGIAVTAREGTRLEDLAAILNSGVCRFYVEATANCIDGGFFAYQKSQLGDLGVAPLDKATRQAISRAPDPGAVDDVLARLYGIALPAGYRR